MKDLCSCMLYWPWVAMAFNNTHMAITYHRLLLFQDYMLSQEQLLL